ncbi:MAG: tetratricopeptide repeat protein [Deltaproteobacteria bacterium]|nr:tetratricopeptide repeat protein [Deltaproteobacteria bacterium]
MPRRSWPIALLLGLCLFGADPVPARAETVQEAYGAALAHFYAGRYPAAVQGLERLVAVPVHHADLFYNLGVAYYRLGKLGSAVYYFERTLALDPAAEDARHNLATAQAQAQARVKDVLRGVASETGWERAVKLLSLRGWTVGFVGLWWLLFGLFALLGRLPPGAARAGTVAVTSFVALLLLGTAVLGGGRLHTARSVRHAVVLPDQVSVREGPAPGTRNLFSLHAGLKVRFLVEEGGFVQIRLANGLEGWVARGELGLL